MIPSPSEHYDYELGKRRIAERLARSGATSWGPTPEARRLQSLTEDLESMANRLGGQEWLYLEAAHDAEPLSNFEFDGSRIDPGFSNAGRFAGLRWRLQELAQTAKEQLEELPSARERNDVPNAAMLFLYLRYECGMPPPTLYDDGKVITEFSQLCQTKNVFLSSVRIRNILSKVLKTFDPHLYPIGLSYILVPLDRSTSSPEKMFKST